MKRGAIAALVLAVIAGAWLLFGRDRGTPPGAARSSAPARASAGSIAPARAPKVKPGQRPAPAADHKVDPAALREHLRDNAAEIADPDPSVPIAPKMAAQATANQKSVLQARETGDHPERYDPKIVPPAFDRKGWVRDPQAYLDVVEPGRVWQPARDASGADPLKIQGDPEVTVVPGDRVILTVMATGGAPVTFTSFDGGVFDNGLASITVRARDNGSAAVSFRATEGTAPEVTVLAASPYNTETVLFTVRIAER